MSVFAGKRVALACETDLGVALAVALSRMGAFIVTENGEAAEAIWNAGGALAEGEGADFTIETGVNGVMTVSYAEGV